MTSRALFLISAALCGFAAIAQTLARVGTPEVTRWFVLTARAALGSTSVGLLLCGAAIFFTLSCASRAREVATRPDPADAARWEAERRCRAYLADTYRPHPSDEASSLLDDSSGPLPEEFRAPCGEPIRFPSSATDRGPRAA